MIGWLLDTNVVASLIAPGGAPSVRAWAASQDEDDLYLSILALAEIDKGIDGPYVAAVHFKFASQDALAAAMGSPGTGDVLADVANYTTIAPVLQTSEIID